MKSIPIPHGPGARDFHYMRDKKHSLYRKSKPIVNKPENFHQHVRQTVIPIRRMVLMPAELK